MPFSLILHIQIPRASPQRITHYTHEMLFWIFQAISFCLISLSNSETPAQSSMTFTMSSTETTATIYFGSEQNSPGYIGSVEEVKDGQPIVAFRGIPYAKAPIGVLRYKPPVPFVETEVRNASEFRAPCLQWDLFGSRNVTGSEDCLHLNLYVVRNQLNGKNTLLPVMVFFHGVGFIAGQSDTYNPEYLVQRDVIVLTVQYRLGALGFLSTGDSMQPGNMGLMDQVEALRWVQKNIPFFHGDATKVTIFGQSAGAVAVSLHLLSPLTKGLFQNAIIESGTILAPFSIQKSPMTHIQRLASNLGCISGDTHALLECIKFSDPREVVASDASAINSVYERKSTRSTKKTPNPGPVIQFQETEGWPTYLGENPLTALNEGRFHKVPVIVGVTRDESASAVINSLIPRLINASSLDPTYPERVFLKKVVKGSGYINNTDILKTAIKFEYFKNYPMSDVSELRDEYISLQSDFSVVAPVYQTVLLLSKFTKTFFYSFEYEGDHSFAEILKPVADREPREPQHRLQREMTTNEKELLEITPDMAAELEKLGGDEFHLQQHNNRFVIHGEELLYVFRFRNPSTGAIIEIDDEEGKHVREVMTTLWSNLAKFGEPTKNETDSIISVPWKAFTSDGPYTLRIAERTSLLISYRHRKMIFWSTHMPDLESLEVPCL